MSFISFLQVWLAVLGIAALAALQHFPKKSISVMLHNPKKKKKNDWRLAAATSGWKNTWFALIIHLRGLNQSQKCCSNVTWPLQLKVDAMRNVILRHSSIDSEFTVKQSKTCRAWVTVWPTANASGGGKKNRILLSHSMHTGKIHTKNLKLIFYLNNHFLEPLSSEQGFLWGGRG